MDINYTLIAGCTDAQYDCGMQTILGIGTSYIMMYKLLPVFRTLSVLDIQSLFSQEVADKHKISMGLGRLSLIYVSSLILILFNQNTIADVYLHIPRGSNNRLDGEKANRRNTDRVFDSQNNAKGGYNAPEKTQNKSSGDWFHMNYYMSGPGKGETILPIEWTNQHGCGHGDLNCNIVLQYKCQPTTITAKHRVMRNVSGISRNRPSYSKRSHRNYWRKNRILRINAGKNRVLNEPWEWYDKCAKRERNKVLFTADQNLNGNETKYTRQNPNGARYGYECPEERDYYPYWHPTDWIDIAVLANNISDCNYYRRESFNTMPKGECMERYPKRNPTQQTRWRHDSKYNNQVTCQANGGKWINFHNYLEITNKSKIECNCQSLIWAIPYRSENIDQFVGEDPEQWKKCLVRLPQPDCKQAPRTRTNHLGNGPGVVPLTHNWVLPHFPSGQEQRWVLRIRYNISTNDYDPKKTFASSNNNDNVISNDPDVNVGKGKNNKVPLQLAINTAQFGRTFQDRSHIFKIIPRKNHFQDCVIHNINVKGKRGNIVQTYPAVEYDFTPKDL